MEEELEKEITSEELADELLKLAPILLARLSTTEEYQNWANDSALPQYQNAAQEFGNSLTSTDDRDLVTQALKKKQKEKLVHLFNLDSHLTRTLTMLIPTLKKAFKSWNDYQNLPKLISSSISGIGEYLWTREGQKETSTVGIPRANFCENLLKTVDLSNVSKLAVIYALLTNSRTKSLKQCVVNKLGNDTKKILAEISQEIEGALPDLPEDTKKPFFSKRYPKFDHYVKPVIKEVTTIMNKHPENIQDAIDSLNEVFGAEVEPSKGLQADLFHK